MFQRCPPVLAESQIPRGAQALRTAAGNRLLDDVPDEEKRRRNNDMLSLQAQISLANNRAMLDRTVAVLAEGPSKSAIKAQESEQSRGQEVDTQAALRDQLVGRTPGDQIVVFDGAPEMVGRILKITITAATPYTLHGIVADGGQAAPSPTTLSLTVVSN